MFGDIAWAWRMLLARRFRRKIGFKSRRIFDDALRHTIHADGVSSQIAYPDAVYHADAKDFTRAKTWASQHEGLHL